MGAQFVTAVGAFLGTFIGIAVQEFGGPGDGAASASSAAASGLLGTGLTWGDMLLPFTAGTFLYVGTVAVIPELLETGKDKGAEIRKTVTQFIAIAAGAGIMLTYVSFHHLLNFFPSGSNLSGYINYACALGSKPNTNVSSSISWT